MEVKGFAVRANDGGASAAFGVWAMLKQRIELLSHGGDSFQKLALLLTGRHESGLLLLYPLLCVVVCQQQVIQRVDGHVYMLGGRRPRSMSLNPLLPARCFLGFRHRVRAKGCEQGWPATGPILLCGRGSARQWSSRVDGRFCRLDVSFNIYGELMWILAEKSHQPC